MILNLALLAFPGKMKSTFTAESNSVLGIERLNSLSREKCLFDLTVYCKNMVLASVYMMKK